MMHYVGWDLGGAHLKVAVCTVQGEIVFLGQVACALGEGVRELDYALSQLEWLRRFRRLRHCITMSGEMADCFATRKQGVLSIAACISQFWKLSAAAKSFYVAQERHPCSFAQLPRYWDKVASANWHASAHLVAHGVGSGIMLDIGSTTTDVVAFLDGTPRISGWSDAKRLCSGELIYRGVVRTPVMVYGPSLCFQGKEYPIIAEYFAKAADVYRLLGVLPPGSDVQPSCDGGRKDLFSSARRLARMFGHDVVRGKEIPFWACFAKRIACRQISLIEKAVDSRHQCFPALKDKPIVGLGCGSFLASSIARKKGVRFIDASKVLDASDLCLKFKCESWLIDQCFSGIAAARFIQASA